MTSRQINCRSTSRKAGSTSGVRNGMRGCANGRRSLRPPARCKCDVWTPLARRSRVGADDVRQSVRVEVKRNAVWRNGRVSSNAGIASVDACACTCRASQIPWRCRQCWRLTYESSQAHNYRGSGSVAPYGERHGHGASPRNAPS